LAWAVETFEALLPWLEVGARDIRRALLVDV
jgi:hypothetical protein